MFVAAQSFSIPNDVPGDDGIIYVEFGFFCSGDEFVSDGNLDDATVHDVLR